MLNTKPVASIEVSGKGSVRAEYPVLSDSWLCLCQSKCFALFCSAFSDRIQSSVSPLATTDLVPDYKIVAEFLLVVSKGQFN